MYLVEVCHSKLVFPEERPDLYMSFKANKQALSQLKIKNLNLLTITFLAIYLLNRGKSAYIH